MKLVVNIQKIERDKWLKWSQDLREIASPLHEKRSMRKVKLTTHKKIPPLFNVNLTSWEKQWWCIGKFDQIYNGPSLADLYSTSWSGEALLDLNIVE